MAATDTFHITPEQAELYEERFVPALFAHWVDAVLEAAGCEPASSCSTSPVAPASSPGTPHNAWAPPDTSPVWT